MSDVSFELSMFIKSHIEQIEREDYKSIYESAYTSLSGDRIEELTNILKRVVEHPEEVLDARVEVIKERIDSHLKDFDNDFEHPITIPSFVKKYMYSTMGLSMSELEELMIEHLNSSPGNFYIDEDDFTDDLIICHAK